MLMSDKTCSAAPWRVVEIIGEGSGENVDPNPAD